MERQVVKWYTRSRKFPQLIGRTHDGTRIPGGPYTPAQFIAAAAIAVVAVNTTDVWARFGMVTNIAILITAGYGTVWLLGRIPLAARNPVSAIFGAARAMSRPKLGTLRGRPVRIRRPRRVHHRITTGALPGDVELAVWADVRRAQTAPIWAGLPRPVAPGSAARPLTGVERTLAELPTSRRNT